MKSLQGKYMTVLSWDDYFMYMAILTKYRSKDPCTQVGACIVNKNNIVIGTGYNGFPYGCKDTEYPWTKGDSDPLKNKYMYVVHAEANAISNTSMKIRDDDNATLYVTLFPCNECAKLIIQNRIKKVIYLKMLDKVGAEASIKMFDSAGIKYQRHKLEGRLDMQDS